MTQLYKTISVFLITGALLIGMAFGTGFSQRAIAEPVTPEAAAYEIDHANSPQEAGQRIQQQAQDYKKELAEDAQYTKHGAKRAAKESQNAIQQAVKTVKAKINPDQSTQSLSKTE